MKRQYIKIIVSVAILFMMAALYRMHCYPEEIFDVPYIVNAAPEEELLPGDAAAPAAVVTSGTITTQGTVTTPGAITTPGMIAAPSAVSPAAVFVTVKEYNICYGLATLEEGIEWANALDVTVEVTLAGEETQYILGQPLHKNVIFTIPQNYEVSITTGHAITMAGILCNDGVLKNEGMIVNEGEINNTGRWESLTLSINNGVVYNSGMLQNEDVIINNGMIRNTGTICGGMITEDGEYEGVLAEITDIEADVYNEVYDGRNHGMITSVSIQEGDTVKYSINGVDYEEEMPQITNVNDIGDVYVCVTRGSIYSWESGRMKANVRQAVPAYTVPEGITAVYGQTLGDIADYLPEGMVFEQSLDTSVGIVGSHVFRAVYTPADTINYAKVIGIKINVNVVKSAAQLKQDKIALPRTVIKKGKLVYMVTKGIVGNCRVKVVKAKNKKYKKIVVPSTIKYRGITYKVKKIDNRAFEKNKKLKKAVIGKNVTTIGNRVFANDRRLSVIRVKAVKLKKVGKKATRHLSPHTKIYVPKTSYYKYKRLILKGRKVKNIKFYKMK